MDESYPGSENSCELSADGEIAATGGPKDHGSLGTPGGGWIYSIKSDNNGSGVDDETPNTPNAFALHPAYPNPANDAVTFSFALPQTGPVTLDIFDIKGRKIDTVLNEELSTGNYEVGVSTGNLASGVYLYRLTAGDNSAVKKMVVK